MDVYTEIKKWAQTTKQNDHFIFVYSNIVYKCERKDNCVYFHQDDVPAHVVHFGFRIRYNCSEADYIDHYCFFAHQVFMTSKTGELTDFNKGLFDILHEVAQSMGVKRIFTTHQYGFYNYEKCFDYRKKNNLPLFFDQLGYKPAKEGKEIHENTILVKLLDNENNG